MGTTIASQVHAPPHEGRHALIYILQRIYGQMSGIRRVFAKEQVGGGRTYLEGLSSQDDEADITEHEIGKLQDPDRVVCPPSCSSSDTSQIIASFHPE